VKTVISAERVIDAPPDVVYHCIADYREHHRPSGFLPPAFSNMTITRGGVGAGTEASWQVTTGGRTQTISAVISEPEPGHVLVETARGLVTTFTVEPAERGARIRFETVIDEGGLSGLMTRLFAPRLLRPLYADEQKRLEDYARAHGPASS
jgi:uncharacterized protein YndB with AHSA1/START domain